MLCILALCGGCLKRSPIWSTYEVPSAYNFLNVNDSAQWRLLTMADQLMAKVDSGNTKGTVVSATALNTLFDSGLAAYCNAAAKTDLQNYFDSVALYSQSTVAGAPGTAGVSGGYLLSPGGTYFAAMIKTALTTGIMAYNIGGLLADSVGNDIPNTHPIPGWGTQMEHAWDEAFGWFGVPIDFPKDTLHLRYLGYYSKRVDSGLQSNNTLMTAFLTGRAAITGTDMGTKQTQASLIIATVEQLEAASAIHELNIADAQPQIAPAALSEALGLIKGLSYYTSASRLITDTQIAQAESYFTAGNIYAGANTAAIRQLLGSVYTFSTTQMAAF
ncbi:MAG TPA: DUF4856 domain-containing protein, partial [Dinghuibacter sp.]|uniref:DUF4856 domain-containing protein n=1 Tax=Dinghuibacter sp. TaxID=2024697 RepID=UPI002C986DF4